MNKQSRKIKNSTKRSRKIKNLTKRSRKIKKKSKLYGGERIYLNANINTQEKCNNYKNLYKNQTIIWDNKEKKCVRERKSDEQN